MELADGEGDVRQGTRGMLLDTQEEGSGKGIDGVDVLEGAGAVHGWPREETSVASRVWLCVAKSM